MRTAESGCGELLKVFQTYADAGHRNKLRKEFARDAVLGSLFSMEKEGAVAWRAEYVTVDELALLPVALERLNHKKLLESVSHVLVSRFSDLPVGRHLNEQSASSVAERAARKCPSGYRALLTDYLRAVALNDETAEAKAVVLMEAYVKTSIRDEGVASELEKYPNPLRFKDHKGLFGHSTDTEIEKWSNAVKVEKARLEKSMVRLSAFLTDKFDGKSAPFRMLVDNAVNEVKSKIPLTSSAAAHSVVMDRARSQQYQRWALDVSRKFTAYLSESVNAFQLERLAGIKSSEQAQAKINQVLGAFEKEVATVQAMNANLVAWASMVPESGKDEFCAALQREENRYRQLVSALSKETLDVVAQRFIDDIGKVNLNAIDSCREIRRITESGLDALRLGKARLNQDDETKSQEERYWSQVINILSTARIKLEEKTNDPVSLWGKIKKALNVGKIFRGLESTVGTILGVVGGITFIVSMALGPLAPVGLAAGAFLITLVGVGLLLHSGWGEFKALVTGLAHSWEIWRAKRTLRSQLSKARQKYQSVTGKPWAEF